MRDILAHKLALAARLSNVRVTDGDRVWWNVESDRVARVVLKLARGHHLYEQNEPCFEEPDGVTVVPLRTLGNEARRHIGTCRERLAESWQPRKAAHLARGHDGFQPLVEVQPDRYRYMTASRLCGSY